MAHVCYFNGKIIPQSKALLPIDDIGILRGYAVFDFAKIYHGVPFLLKEHCARLKYSTKRLGLTLPVSDKKIEEIIQTLLSKNKMKDACVRIIVTGGKTIDGLQFDKNNPTFAILLEPVKELPEKLYIQGAKLITHTHERVFSDIKTTNYITAVSLQAAKKKAKAVEILYLHDNKILECTTSNFFLIKNNTLITPKNNILIGITRNFVLTLAKAAGFTVEERDVTTKEIVSATEAFITASNKEIMPIVQIDQQKIGNGKVGGHTKMLMSMFNDVITNLK